MMAGMRYTELSRLNVLKFKAIATEKKDVGLIVTARGSRSLNSLSFH